MVFWQNIVLKWKQIQQFCLWALSSDPSGLIESGMYYNTTANRAALRDDTKTQLLAHLEDTYKNAGVIKQPTITKGTNSITVGNDAVIRCYKTTDYSGIIQEIENPTGGTFAIAQNVDQWLIYTYGVGYSIISSIPTGPLSNIVPVFRYFNAFGVIHSSTQDELGKGAIEKTLARIARTEYIERVGESGIELSTSGLNVLISGGYAYNASVIETILPFNSATNNLYRVTYDDGVWSQETLHALTNTQYNHSTGLASLNSNKYCWAYVWRSVGDDVEAFFQLGENEYATEALAVADLCVMPANLYGLYVTHCVLVGYVLIKQGVTTTQFFSAWGRPTVAGAPVYHNTLAGIDAGDPGTSYLGHTKLIDNTRLNAAGAANGFALLGADGKLPSGQLPSYVDDVLEYATKANFPVTGENGKIYVDLATNLTWRWSGTTYVEISPSLALGETSATAYRGDRGKTAYDHSQVANGNPHGTTAAQISSTATGDVAATNVQAAIAELASEKLARDGSQTITGNLNFQGVSGTASRYIQFGVGDNDFARVMAGANAENDGWLEIATADDGQEPIYLRQYIGVFSTVKRSATLLDALGNTQFPGTVTATGFNGHATSATHSWAMRQDGIFEARNIDVPLGGHGEFIAYNVRNPKGALPMSSIWCYITEHHHSEDDNLHYVQTFIDFWADRKFWRTCEGGALSAWAEDATTAWVKDVAAPINATLTNEPAQDVLPTGTYAITAILQWFRNNLSQLFTSVAGKAPTSHASTATTYGCSDATNFGHAMASSAAPAMNGTASAGTDNGKFTREGHVHPSDTSKMTGSARYVGALTTSQMITPSDGSMFFINGSGLTITLSNAATDLTTVYLVFNASCGYSQHAIQFYDFAGVLKVLKTRPYTGTVENGTIMARRVLNGWMVIGY